MNRRDVVAGLVSLGVLGGGALVASGMGEELLRNETVPETTLETIDANGSEAGETVVPERGSVTFVDFFATWCSDCVQYLGNLAEFYERVPDEVQFVSVTTEQIGTAVTRQDVSDWFNGTRRETAVDLDPTTPNHGDWTVGIDPSLRLAEPLGATSVPHSFVIDESNRIVWSDSGIHTVKQLEAALSKSGSTGQ